MYIKRSVRGQILPVILLLVVGRILVVGQGLESKLSQKTDFVPSATSTKEQLIEVAQHYKIPVGIEWGNVNNRPAPHSPLAKQPTVRDLISSILRDAPGYKLEIKAGVINIFDKSLKRSPRNFLNIRIPEYHVDKENIFGAQALLRLSIHKALNGERYESGSNGGYGFGIPRTDTFDIKNLSFSSENASVRDILNSIVGANGNALWSVELTPSRMMKTQPFFAQDEWGTNVDFVWRIVPFN
jgi:hypothetical protein